MSDIEKIVPSPDESVYGNEKLTKKVNLKKPKNISKTPTIAFKLSVVFILFWISLHYFAVLRFATDIPEQLKIQTEHMNHGKFIGERAEQILVKLENIGERVVGSHANEVKAVNLIMDEVKKIRSMMNNDLFEMEIDLQQASGAYMHWKMLNMYQGVQNIAVKLNRKENASDAYFLIVTHFDSKPGSTGTGDDGAMVVTALEVLRVLAIGNEAFRHPIVFLFNGAEENPLQSSHAFIMQHKWAKNVKIFLNLESAGSANRDMLFQTGPNHPWLMKYYKKHAVHPHCTSLAEEIFETGRVPSDTDFRIFRDFGNIPGMDMAHTYGGHVYHTKFDKLYTIPSGTIQNSGENVLALAKAFANAPELEDPSKYASGHVVFFDVLGKFVISYTMEEGVQINYAVAIGALVVVLVSVLLIGSNTGASQGEVVGEFFVTFILHIVGVILGVGLAILIAVQLDNFNLTLSWFTNKWMVVGLYFCPTIFGMGFPTAIYISSSNKKKINLSYRVQLVLNSHLVLMVILTGVVTYLGLRSAYIFMLSTLFYTITLIFNTLTTLYKRDIKWTVTVVIGQILPFMYYTYLSYFIYFSIVPVMGRIGIDQNPELYIGGISLLVAILSLGFLIPLFNLFRQPKTILSLFLICTAVFVGLSMTPIGFPFRAETTVERFNWLHVRREFYQPDNTLSTNDSGYYFDPQDRRIFSTLKDTMNISQIIPVADRCYEEMNCGMPVFNHRWHNARKQAYWLPSDYAKLPGPVPNLTLVEKTSNSTAGTIKLHFKLECTPHTGIHINPRKGVKVVNWSFITNMLDRNWTPPYFIFYSKGNDLSDLYFNITVKSSVLSVDDPLIQIAVGGHWLSKENPRSSQLLAFKESFPSFAFSMCWPTSYVSRYY